MKEFPMKLLGELIAVQPEPDKHTVLLPDWQKSLKGKVFAVGPECPELKVGDRVVFGAAIGMESVFNGEPIRIMKESDVDAVLA